MASPFAFPAAENAGLARPSRLDGSRFDGNIFPGLFFGERHGRRFALHDQTAPEKATFV